jgi:hypothetical protein
MGRFVIEGTWSGYQSSQRRVVHRTVHDSHRHAYLRDFVAKTQAIHYTDNTALFLTVLGCKPYERVKEIHGYDKLIADCARHGVVSVAALSAAENAKRGPDAT